jgi:hypothetical protein
MGGLRPDNSGVFCVQTPLSERLTGAVFRSLVARAGDELVAVDISGAAQPTDEDLLCLKKPASPKLTSFAFQRPYYPHLKSPKSSITATGIAAALHGRKLLSIDIMGVQEGTGGGLQMIASLKRLLCTSKAPIGTLDVTTVCKDCGRLVKEWRPHESQPSHPGKAAARSHRLAAGCHRLASLVSAGRLTRMRRRASGSA